MKKTNPALAQDIVGTILMDLTSRPGLARGWAALDEDTRDTILRSWLLSTKRLLDENEG